MIANSFSFLESVTTSERTSSESIIGPVGCQSCSGATELKGLLTIFTIKVERSSMSIRCQSQALFGYASEQLLDEGGDQCTRCEGHGKCQRRVRFRGVDDGDSEPLHDGGGWRGLA